MVSLSMLGVLLSRCGTGDEDRRRDRDPGEAGGRGEVRGEGAGHLGSGRGEGAGLICIQGTCAVCWSWRADRGWGQPRIGPHTNISLSPASKVRQFSDVNTETDPSWKIYIETGDISFCDMFSLDLDTLKVQN